MAALVAIGSAHGSNVLGAQERQRVVRGRGPNHSPAPPWRRMSQAVDSGACLASSDCEACRVRIRGDMAGGSSLRRTGLWPRAYRHRVTLRARPAAAAYACGRGEPGARVRDGRWSALHGYPIFQHAKAAGSLYQAQLRAAVRERLPRAQWGEVRNGMAELEGVQTEVLAHFSRPAGRDHRVARVRGPVRSAVGGEGGAGDAGAEGRFGALGSVARSCARGGRRTRPRARGDRRSDRER